MFQQETPDTDRFEQAILLSVRQILSSPGPDAFLAWARNRIPELLGLESAELDEIERRRLANLLGTAIWNATPQPGNGFRTSPMVPIADSAPCPCGSGEPHGECCGAFGEPPQLSEDLIWSLLLDELTEPLLRAALDSGAIPRPLLAGLADRWLEEDRPGRAVALLEPLFAGPLGELSGELEPALSVLCDAYDRLDHWRKKRAFLDRVCEEGGRALQAAAWQRRSTILIDEGDFRGAEAAFAAALRSDPDNPGTALLEITLLSSQHKNALARERARFWLHRLKRAGCAESAFLDFLAQVIDDPQEAMVESHSDALDPVLLELHDWVRDLADRPLPEYRTTPLKAAGPPAGAGQLDLFEDRGLADAGGGTPHPGNPSRLRAPPPVRRIDAAWRRLFPCIKPVSTRLTAAGGDSVWESAEWVELLLAHPEASDSLDVLDDLATALYEHPESALPWIAHAVLRPLLERAWSIVGAAVPAGSRRQLPWSAEANRPALRLLFRRYLCTVEEDDPAEAARTLEAMLRLNPRDNHGVRAELMNHYLRIGEDRRALSLARSFPDDRLADLAYGEVLALFRLGERERARQALRTAVVRLPRIPRYLTRKRIRQPASSPLGVIPGGDDQAWLYREAMRDVWEAEPGVLAWLKRMTA